jgi:hypothetical protein
MYSLLTELLFWLVRKIIMGCMCSSGGEERNGYKILVQELGKLKRKRLRKIDTRTHVPT